MLRCNIIGWVIVNVNVHILTIYSSDIHIINIITLLLLPSFEVLYIILDVLYHLFVIFKGLVILDKWQHSSIVCCLLIDIWHFYKECDWS